MGRKNGRTTLRIARRWEQNATAMLSSRFAEKPRKLEWLYSGSKRPSSRPSHSCGLTCRKSSGPRIRPSSARSSRGARELWWPTLSDFERGVAGDRAAFDALLAQAGQHYQMLDTAARVIF